MRHRRSFWPGRNGLGPLRVAGYPLATRLAIGLVGLLAPVVLAALVAPVRQEATGAAAEPAAAPTAVSLAASQEPPAAPTAATIPPTAAPTPTALPAPTMTPAPTPIARINVHTVAPGETLRLLAERYGVSIETVIAANDLEDPNLLLVGQQLRVPTVNGVVHTLRPGETARQVAERHGVPADAVIEANGLGASPDLDAVGTLLLLPGVTPPAWVPASAPGPDGPQQRADAAPREAVPEVAPPVPRPANEAPGLASRPLATGPRRVSDAPPPAVTARYVAILDEASGGVLHGQGEHTRVAPASVTKIATALVALERAPDLGRRIPVTISGAAMAARDGSSIMGLEPGRQVSLATLLYGLMLPSGNDAAEQLAVALGGSRETYVAWMNQEVADLGLRDTHFVNPSGMDAAGHYSSAYDMALLGRAAMRDETFRRLAGAATYRGDGYSLTNLNRLIGAYPGADGIKIGFTRAAGRTIVASASRDGHRVYVSLLRSQDLPGDSTALFEWVWRTFAW